MLTKVAVIREPGHPVGQPAPCYLNCPCGAKPALTGRGSVVCACGTIYDERGWIIYAVHAVDGN